jgi:predicted CXXCH cytochrome family protein
LAGDENVLWNHEETTETFTMYSSSAGQPESTSKMCLSCHDGVTALDSYGGTSGSVPLAGTANLGTDLSDDHPIGIEYPVSQTYDYNNPSTFAAGINGGPGVTLVTIATVDRVECTSCHHVHNNGLGDFLRVPLQESYLCLQCHIK